jgi:hypothetical protein
MAHGQELRQQKIDQHQKVQKAGEKAQRRRAEAMIDPVARRDEAVLSRAVIELRGEEQIDHHHRHHKAHAQHPEIADTVGLPGQTQQRIAAVLGGIEGEQQDQGPKAFGWRDRTG